MSRACPLLVFADDWGRHPSSAQHLIAQLRERHPVLWVNTIGTRTPSLDLGTLRRGLEKLRHWTRPAAAPPDNPRVVNPWMWPWFSSPLARRLNRALLLRQLRPVLDTLPQAPVAVTTLPIVADLIGHVPVARWVYYCVDDFAEWPGLDGPALRTMEEKLVRDADVVIAVSETLRQRLADLGRQARLLTHGVDLDFWRSEGDGTLAEVERLPRPRALFWGVIDRRMDVAFVRRLAADMEGGTVLLVGPQQQPDPELLRLERVAVLPPLQFEQLPPLARAADVLIMPYADAPVTRAMQPLKLKEYLATGKPVVVRDLPATRDWHDCLDLASSAEEFSRLVRRRIQLGVCPHQLRARQRLDREGWAAKASAFVEWASEHGEVIHA
jgi:glycosyltransferase involved in cell wall biosynthesis